MGILIALSATALALYTASLALSLGIALASRRRSGSVVASLTVLSFVAATVFAFTVCGAVIASPPHARTLLDALKYVLSVLAASAACVSPLLARIISLWRCSALPPSGIDWLNRIGATSVAVSYLIALLISFAMCLPLAAALALGACLPIAVGELVDRIALRRVCEWRSVPGYRVCVVEDPRPRALSAGLIAPQIVASSALIELLEPLELEAILAHESYHARKRHSLVSLIASLTPLTACIHIATQLATYGSYLSMLLIPATTLAITLVVRRLLGRFMELRADEYAVHVVGAQPLARALIKLCGHPEPKREGIERVFYALLSPHPPVSERLRHLMRAR